jgi:hypothetical protein
VSTLYKNDPAPVMVSEFALNSVELMPLAEPT